MADGLEAAKLKLDWAAKHIKEIGPHVTAYAAHVLHEVVTNPEGRETVNVREFPPPEIAVLAGETLYHIRSSLDYLAFDLVQLNPLRLTLRKGWEERCCFPLWMKIPKKPPVYNCFGDVLPGISKAAFTFIEGVQPYHRRDAAGIPQAGVPEVLWFLAQLSNIDKHRHLNLTPIGIGHTQMIVNKVGMGRFVYRMIRSGAELEPATPSENFTDIVKVETEFSSYVTFDESALGSGPDIFAVQYVLETCLDVVQGVIVPAFVEFLKNP